MEDAQRFTTVYSDLEDRIHLLIALKNELTVGVGLSRRLMSRLVPPLVEWLQGQEVSVRQGGGADVGQAKVLQSFAQEAARSLVLSSGPAVQLQSSDRFWLVNSIDLTRSKDKVRLLFKGVNSADQVALLLSKDFVRQWLNMLYDLTQQADWALSCWPDWMGSGERSKNERANFSLH